MIRTLAVAFAVFSIFLVRPAAAVERVDLELVLAVDISRSMDIGEQILQRKGYAEAFRSPEVIEAITGGGYGRIVVTYMEWAGTGTDRVVVPWTLIDSAEAAIAFANRLDEQQPERLSRTSISHALESGGKLFGTSGYEPLRQVIDVSGDGPNNQGLPVTMARDELVNRGVVINGLPLMVRISSWGFVGIEKLDEYYFDCVVGGTGAFVLPVYSWEKFPEAVKKKLVLEIAGLEPRLMKAADDGASAMEDPNRPRTDCLIGEKLWEQRMRDMEWR